MQGFIDFIVIQVNFDYVVIVLYLKLSEKLKKTQQDTHSKWDKVFKRELSKFCGRQ